MSLLMDMERLAVEVDLMAQDCAEMKVLARRSGDDAKAARWNLAGTLLDYVRGQMYEKLNGHWPKDSA